MKKVFVLIIAVSLGLLFTVYFFATQKPLRKHEELENVFIEEKDKEENI